MKRLATLLTIAGISLVAYSGAVYATLGQEMPDSAPEPVYSAVEAVEEPEPVIEDIKPVEHPRVVEEVYNIPSEEQVVENNPPLVYKPENCKEPTGLSLQEQVEAIASCYREE